MATVLALLALAGAVAPSRVHACSSEHPTFEEAVRGAQAIARVTIIDGFDTVLDDPTHSETYRVERIFKGSLPAVVTIAPAWSSLCHDSVGYYAGAENSDGATIIVAIELLYYDQVIHPMWAADNGGHIMGSAEVPDGVSSLAALESAILGELSLPQTSTEEPDSEIRLLPQVVAAFSFLLIFRRLGTRKASEPT